MHGVPHRNVQLRPHQRFLTLDALRGLGAIFVMAGHSGRALGGYVPAFYSLSVDMFFLLSGFVIAHAYDRRFSGDLTRTGFLKARLDRLYPIYFVGLLLGLVAGVVVNTHALSAIQLGITFAFGIFALPSPPMDKLGALFPLNGPFWSLFFEFWVANLAYCLLWRQLRGRTLWAVVAAAAVGVLLADHRFHTMDSGWTWDTFVGGVARVCFSFFAGVGLSRLHAVRPPRLRIPSWACLAAFVLVMLPPLQGRMARAYEIFVVFAFFPALIYWGAGAIERNPRIGKALGDVSYAAYAIHRPVLTLFAWLLAKAAASAVHAPLSYAVQAGFIAGAALLAWSVNKVATTRRKPVGAVSQRPVV
jgi:peptidoglycan/LPS O-acetylase OafA/YrhL